MSRSSRRRRDRPAGTASAPGARARPAEGQGAARAGGAARAAGGAGDFAECGALALVLAAAAWLHARVISFGFFADDYLFLDQVRQHSLWSALTSRDPLGNFMRPVSRQLHFWLAAHAAGESPVPFHLANLAYFLLALFLFERIARRFMRPAAAIAATALLALTYAADVPLLWASGSQDLMAMAFAIAALWLHVNGRRAWGAAAYALALLCKETVLLTPVIAWLLDSGESPARRTRNLAPMGIALAAWALIWFATRSLRPAAGATLHADPAFALAALLHLIQSAFALEWGDVSLREGWRWPSLVVLAGMLLAVMWVASGEAPGAKEKKHARADGRIGGQIGGLIAGEMGGLIAGLGWAVCGALPVAAVAPIWSSYYYLFAMAGVALAVGAALSRAPRYALVGVIALAALLNARGSAREEFATATGAWTMQSHVTRFYLERAGMICEKLLGDLRGIQPALPKNSTLFFSGVPSNIGWQAGDGPLVRWAYRDTSLRSYFLNQFSYARAQRGPVFFFRIADGALVALWQKQPWYSPLSLNMILDDHPECARDALRLMREGAGLGDFERYMKVWLDLDAGAPDSARAGLLRLGQSPVPGPAPEAAAALKMITANGDTLRAMQMLWDGVKRHPFDQAAHGLLADLLYSRRQMLATAQMEAYAARVIAPDTASNWRRWAEVQLSTNRQRQAALSLDRYFALAGASGERDAEAHYWRTQLARIMPGGDLAQKALRGTPEASGAFAPPGGSKR